jgi:uncharacterized membrane protein YfcA
MAAGSIAGTLLGGLLLGMVPSAVLIPLLMALLAASAVKLWRHKLGEKSRRGAPAAQRGHAERRRGGRGGW